MTDKIEPTAAELKVIAAAAAGEGCDFQVGDAPKDDPAGAAAWGPERTVRAEIVYALCVGTRADWPVHAKGVRIGGARIAGALDFDFAELKCPLWLKRCHIAERAVFRHAAIPALYMAGCMVEHGITANGLTVKGDVVLDGTTAKGEVRLIGANIGGQLSCVKATFENTDGAAFVADGLTVKGSVFLDDATAKGEVRLLGASIGGQLGCERATFKNTSGAAFSADGLTVRGDVFLRDTTAKGLLPNYRVTDRRAARSCSSIRRGSRGAGG